MIQSERYILLFKDVPEECQQMPELPIEERARNFEEVELGFTKEQAILEASRCLSCRACLGCGLCAATCHARAIELANGDKEIEIEVDSIVVTPGVERICSSIEEKFGYGKYLNVVNFVEFERILSDAGPYGGLVLRPYDGEIPRKIAFVQCSKERDNGLLFSYATKEALYAQQKTKDLEAHLFLSGTGFDELKKYSGRSSKITCRVAEVIGMKEKEADRNLIIKFLEDGRVREEEFDMAVLLTWLELPSYVKGLSEKWGLRLKSETFCEVEDISLKETSKPGVFFAGYYFDSNCCPSKEE